MDIDPRTSFDAGSHDNSGALIIEFDNNDDFDRVCLLPSLGSIGAKA
jgi:hypothetical protein